MNQNNKKTRPHPILGLFEPIEDLLYYDCPYVFTFLDAEDALAIAYLSTMDEKSSHYLAVRIEEQDLMQLKAGTLPLRRIFRDWVWDITVDGDADIASVRKRSIQELDAGSLPPADFRL